MADFTIVMHEMQRMCEAFIKKDGQNCPLINNPVCGSPVDMDGKDIAKAEAAIMVWAAEHPEPKYPTWYEYLVKERILVPRENYARYDLWNLLISQLQGTSISAEIAEKLGIEPKEETYDKN